MSACVQPPSVCEILGKLSAHLDMLAGQIFSVEEALGAALAAENAASPISITKFQSLDFTRQSLEDCALLLLALSQEKLVFAADPDDADLARKLKLDSTKALVQAKTGALAPSTSGELDLF